MRLNLKSIAIACSMLLSCAIFAQEISYGSATVSTPACIILDSDEPLMVNYEMDITPLGFTSEEELNVWTGHYSNNLITLSGNYSAGTAYIKLHNERMTEAKDLAWWNDYLSDLCTYYIEN